MLRPNSSPCHHIQACLLRRGHLPLSRRARHWRLARAHTNQYALTTRSFRDVADPRRLVTIWCTTELWTHTASHRHDGSTTHGVPTSLANTSTGAPSLANGRSYIHAATCARRSGGAVHSANALVIGFPDLCATFASS